MHTLRMLGGIGLSDAEGREMDALLRQPKHVALLAYLAIPRPGTWHRREIVLGTFWPEHDQARARAALRSALYNLRRQLPEGTIVSRGDDELSLDPVVIRTDVAAMSDDVAAGRFGEAVARYVGELLPGIYVADSPGFEKWLDSERSRARGIARKAATQLSASLERNGDLDAAIDAARRASELDPDDEAAARRWIALLDRAGDRAQAFAVYERFRSHMSDSFGVRPSAETVALLDAVRTRRDVVTPAPNVTSPVFSETLQAPAPVTIPPEAGSASALSGIQAFDAMQPNARTDSHPLSAPLQSPVVRNPFFRSWWIAVPIAIAGLLLFATRPRREAAATAATRSLVVLPMTNETGDPKLAYIATGIAEGVARRLEGIGGITVRSGARSDWTATTRHDMQTVGREFGTTILLRGALRKSGDTLELLASVVDATTNEERRISTRRFSTEGIRDAESGLAADVAGAVFRVAVPAMPARPTRSIDPESYRLMLEGYHSLLSNPARNPPGSGPRREIAAGDLFAKAVHVDPSNAGAWSGLSSVWASQAVRGAIPFDEGFERASAAALRALALDSLQGAAWANLAVVRAMKYRNLEVGLELIRKAEAAEPSDPEVYLIKAALLRSAHLYDRARDASRIARRLDPLSSQYVESEAITGFCAGRPEAALALYESELSLNPSDRIAGRGRIRALALLGRYDEAIAAWRQYSAAEGDTALTRRLAGAKGKGDYWRVKHAEGRKRLASQERRSGQMSPFHIMIASFAAGDADAGFSMLTKAAEENLPALYRLSCVADIDEFRNTPQFAAAVARIGPLPSR